jgi:hypothetical protein
MRTRRLTLGSVGIGLCAAAIAFGPASSCSAAPPANHGEPAAAASAAGEKPAMPDWKAVASTAKTHFQTLPNYRAGDIVSQGQVKPLLVKLAKAGWKVSDEKALLAQICPDDDFVVRQLRTKSGQKFMRSTGGSAEQYDYLRRLAETKGGDRTVADILKLPNGSEVLSSLVESKAGKDISRRLAEGPRTQGYNTPTGMLYTETQILTRIEESYSRDAGRAK